MQSYYQNFRRKNHSIIPCIPRTSVSSFFLEHFKILNLFRQGTSVQRAPDVLYYQNHEFWEDIINENTRGLHWVTLENFQIVGWYPRSPGLYHTAEARDARQQAEEYLDRSEINGVKVYKPRGKQSMIDGGIGSVRFKTIQIEGEDFWLCTATSDQYCHSGIPIAVPNALYREIDVNAGDYFSIVGEVRYLPDFIQERYFYSSVMVPQVYVLVERLECLHISKRTVIITPVVFFKQQDNEGGATFVNCYSSNFIEINIAAQWIQKYVRQYGGKIITNFDQQRPIFEDAPFSLQNLIHKRADVFQLNNLDLENATLIIESVQKIYSEKTQMTKVNVQLGDHATIYGDLVVAQSIRDSFNNVTSSDVPDNLKDLLQELAVTVGKMSEQLPEQSAQQVARDLETLTAEATSQLPRRPWWELSTEGLKSAASSIGEVGKPVLSVIARLLPLLNEISN